MADIISFEGLDGSGKTTQLQIFKKYLQDRGYKVLSSFEPGSTDLGKRLRELILENNYLNPVSIFYLFLSDRYEHISKIIEPNYHSYDFILIDRYIDSTIAYQQYGMQIDKFIIQSVKSIDKRYIPKLTFFLDISLIRQRIRMEGKDRFESKDTEFYRRVREGYKAIWSGDKKRVIRIDANSKIDKVSIDIVNQFSKRFDIFSNRWKELPSLDVSFIDPEDYPLGL